MIDIGDVRYQVGGPQLCGAVRSLRAPSTARLRATLHDDLLWEQWMSAPGKEALAEANPTA